LCREIGTFAGEGVEIAMVEIDRAERDQGATRLSVA